MFPGRKIGSGGGDFQKVKNGHKFSGDTGYLQGKCRLLQYFSVNANSIPQILLCQSFYKNYPVENQQALLVCIGNLETRQ